MRIEMKEFLFLILSFLNFLFYPFIIIFVVSFLVEQFVRKFADSDPQSYDDARDIDISMRVRKFFFRQNVILNSIWVICYLSLLLILRSEVPSDPLGNPGLMWNF